MNISTRQDVRRCWLDRAYALRHWLLGAWLLLLGFWLVTYVAPEFLWRWDDTDWLRELDTWGILRGFSSGWLTPDTSGGCMGSPPPEYQSWSVVGGILLSVPLFGLQAPTAWKWAGRLVRWAQIWAGACYVVLLGLSVVMHTLSWWDLEYTVIEWCELVSNQIAGEAAMDEGESWLGNFVPLLVVVWSATVLTLALAWRLRGGISYWQRLRLMPWAVASGFALLLYSVSNDLFTEFWFYRLFADSSERFIALSLMLWGLGAGVLMLRRYPQERALRAGQSAVCLACHYDLRGTLAAGRGSCPECGAGIAVGSVDGVSAPA